MSGSCEIYAIRYANLGGRRIDENFITSPRSARAGRRSRLLRLVDPRQGRRPFWSTPASTKLPPRPRNRKLIIHPVDALKKFGVAAETIRDVVISHFHYDHAGNLDRFPNVKFHIQDREMAFVTGRCMCHGFMRFPFNGDDVVHCCAATGPENPATTNAAATRVPKMYI
jgi:glyoxylase-like metal-dependent hydrolase (beta-lactamase superfamily II)